MKQELTITTFSNYDAVRLIGAIANKVFEELFTDRDDIYSSELAIVEACNNVVEHAHKDRPYEKIILKFLIENEKVEVRIFDRGDGIKKLLNNAKTLEKLDIYSESSRGLPIIKTVMDEVSYKEYKNKNVLSLVKYRKK